MAYGTYISLLLCAVLAVTVKSHGWGNLRRFPCGSVDKGHSRECYWPQSTHTHTHTHTHVYSDLWPQPRISNGKGKRESPSGRRLSNLLKNDADCLWQQVQWKAPERDRGRNHRDESPTPVSRDRSSGGVGYTHRGARHTPARVSLTARMTDILPLTLPPTTYPQVISNSWQETMVTNRFTKHELSEHEMSPYDLL